MGPNDFLRANSEELKELLGAIDEVTENLKVGVELLSSPSVTHERYLNNHQVCEMLHLSQRTLQDYRDKRKIAFYKLEGKILYKLSDIEKMLESNYYKAWEQD